MWAAALSQALPLSQWENFYVIVGSSAGALTGLTFIVITIAADPANRAMDQPGLRLRGLRAFITPTAVYFVSALWVSALMSVPGQTAFSLAICLGVSGVAGLVYCIRVILWMRGMRTDDYTPFFSDWVWSAFLPLIAHLGLLAAAFALPRYPVISLYVVGGITLQLLIIGIHNAWDVIVWMTTERHARRERQQQQHERGSSHGPASQRSAAERKRGE
jgi:modulator of FtsH protease